jgi:hypothetical protein
VDGLPLPSENTAIRMLGSDCTVSLDLLIGGKRQLVLLGKGVWQLASRCSSRQLSMALRRTLSCHVDSLAPMARRCDRSALDEGGASSTGSALHLFLPGRLGTDRLRRGDPSLLDRCRGRMFGSRPRRAMAWAYISFVALNTSLMPEPSGGAPPLKTWNT